MTQATPGTAQQPMPCSSQEFPAHPRYVREARAFLGRILAESPVADDAVLCLSELAANAVVHSRSREPGGSFTVRAQFDSARLRVEVCDQGGPWHTATRTREGDPNGRGLLIVSQLATRWGCEGHSQTGWNVWFEIEGRPAGQGGR